MCCAHYRRQKRYGRLEKKHNTQCTSHPLYHLWMDRKGAGLLCDAWLEFWVFVRDVSPKPKQNCYLVRPHDGPFGPLNFEWQKTLQRMPGETLKQWWARKWAHRQAENPGMERVRELKRRFNMTVEQYEELLASQDGRCAICRKPETAPDRRTGEARRLAVDHCHTTNAVRGLLCFRCNSAIGRIEESIPLLDAMRTYLLRCDEIKQEGS